MPVCAINKRRVTYEQGNNLGRSWEQDGQREGEDGKDELRRLEKQFALRRLS
ncbi:hypothetical protein KSF_108210 [Reticulibacter mediterranei]|uniref:Uncharacterized protein n=1 Tax=Reticulibacter mediterranei TaxID=2778369 RepID=A0A8J3IUD5_9CHLR|nr:hypothetical protein KSF_108210 [Reticulibacter mediterranei]